MNEETLRQLIAGGESATIEFKIKAPRPAELAERICGMANTRTGGMIIFGVADATREPVGVAEPSDTIDIALRAARMLKPALPITDTTIQRWTLDARTLVTLQIPANLGTLYQYDGAFLVRRGTHTVALALDEIHAYLNAFGISRWEIAAAPRASLEDINAEAVEQHLSFRAAQSRSRQRYVEPADLLLTLEAATHDPQSGTVRPTNAGLLMFGYDPQLQLPQSEVVCIKYADSLGVRSYIDRRNLRGTLPELIVQASQFLRQFIRVGATIRGFYREDEPEYPYEALREAVVNAIVHRDYSRVGETVRLFMYADRVEVRSPGGLLPGITLDELVALRVRSVPRNPVLAGYLATSPVTWSASAQASALWSARCGAWGCPIRSSPSTTTLSSPSATAIELRRRRGLTNGSELGCALCASRGASARRSTARQRVLRSAPGCVISKVS